RLVRCLLYPASSYVGRWGPGVSPPRPPPPPPLSTPRLFEVRFTPETLHWFVLAVVTASYLLLRRITRSPFGMVLQAIRENEGRTRAIGYPVERYKIVAGVVSGPFRRLARGVPAVQNPLPAPRLR